jgi:phosphoserine phosphatase
MTHVATLISSPSAPALAVTTIDRARAVLAIAGQTEWLCPGIAADIPFTSGEPFDNRALSDRLRAAVHPERIDVVVQPAAGRRKKLFLADMDSTMIAQECIDELADHVGLKAHVAAITELAMRGDIEFASALRERVALLRGLPAAVAEEVVSARITLTQGARVLIATMRKNGAYTCLVTGGFTLFTERIAAMIGFDENHANRLELDASGRLTGRVVEPIFGREGKLATLVQLTERLGLSPRDTLAAGDGANDLAMIEAAGLGVAFHAKPKIAAAAAARIDHGDLTALLYAQGYRREEFVEPDDERQGTDQTWVYAGRS